jgi:histidine ammonia-lyase
VLAIELLAGTQGIEFLAPLEPGAGARAGHDAVRLLSPRVADDRPLAGDIEATAQAIREGAFVRAVESEVGELR